MISSLRLNYEKNYFHHIVPHVNRRAVSRWTFAANPFIVPNH